MGDIGCCDSTHSSVEVMKTLQEMLEREAKEEERESGRWFADFRNRFESTRVQEEGNKELNELQSWLKENLPNTGFKPSNTEENIEDGKEEAENSDADCNKEKKKLENQEEMELPEDENDATVNGVKSNSETEAEDNQVEMVREKTSNVNLVVTVVDTKLPVGNAVTDGNVDHCDGLQVNEINSNAETIQKEDKVAILSDDTPPIIDTEMTVADTVAVNTVNDGMGNAYCEEFPVCENNVIKNGDSFMNELVQFKDDIKNIIDNEDFGIKKLYEQNDEQNQENDSSDVSGNGKEVCQFDESEEIEYDDDDIGIKNNDFKEIDVTKDIVGDEEVDNRNAEYVEYKKDNDKNDKNDNDKNDKNGNEGVKIARQGDKKNADRIEFEKVRCIKKHEVVCDIDDVEKATQEDFVECKEVPDGNDKDGTRHATNGEVVENKEKAYNEEIKEIDCDKEGRQEKNKEVVYTYKGEIKEIDYDNNDKGGRQAENGEMEGCSGVDNSKDGVKQDIEVPGYESSSMINIALLVVDSSLSALHLSHHAVSAEDIICDFKVTNCEEVIAKWQNESDSLNTENTKSSHLTVENCISNENAEIKTRQDEDIEATFDRTKHQTMNGAMLLSDINKEPSCETVLQTFSRGNSLDEVDTKKTMVCTDYKKTKNNKNESKIDFGLQNEPDPKKYNNRYGSSKNEPVNKRINGIDQNTKAGPSKYNKELGSNVSLYGEEIVEWRFTMDEPDLPCHKDEKFIKKHSKIMEEIRKKNKKIKNEEPWRLRYERSLPLTVNEKGNDREDDDDDEEWNLHEYEEEEESFEEPRTNRLQKFKNVIKNAFSCHRKRDQRNAKTSYTSHEIIQMAKGQIEKLYSSLDENCKNLNAVLELYAYSGQDVFGYTDYIRKQLEINRNTLISSIMILESERSVVERKLHRKFVSKSKKELLHLEVDVFDGYLEELHGIKLTISQAVWNIRRLTLNKYW